MEEISELREALRALLLRQAIEQDLLVSRLLAQVQAERLRPTSGPLSRSPDPDMTVMEEVAPGLARNDAQQALRCNGTCATCAASRTPPLKQQQLPRALMPSEASVILLNISGLDRVNKRQSLAERVLHALQGQDRNCFVPSRMVALLARGLRWVDTVVEPPRVGCAARLVRSSAFGMLCVAVIGLNALFIMYTTDYEMQHMNEPPTAVASAFEAAFAAFYTVELVLKIAVHRCYFFVNADMKWNLFDLLLVGFSCLETTVYILFGADAEGQSGMKLGFLRAFRLFKIAKLLRVFRTLRFLTDLRLMLDCVLGSFLNLFWCLVMIAFVVYVFALLLMQGCTQTLRDDAAALDAEDVALIHSYFGSVKDALVTLLQSVTNGLDWRSIFMLLDRIDSVMPWVYMFYILFFVIAAWNIVTSNFVEKALKLARPDLETLTLEQNMRDVSDAEELTKLFKEADQDGSSAISFGEFRHVAEHPRFRAYLHVRGIDIKNVELFYQMLSSVSPGEKVDIRTMVNACLRMKGLATSIDLHSLSYETKIMGRKQHAFLKECRDRLKKIEEVACRVQEVPRAPCDAMASGASPPRPASQEWYQRLMRKEAASCPDCAGLAQV